MKGGFSVEGSSWFHAHAHSHFSTLDAMSKVSSMVEKAVANGQPALALTDHGLGSGWVRLYKECKRLGIKPFPGIETYLIDPDRDDWEEPEKGAPPVGRYHVGLLALDEEGYKALVRFTSLTHTRPRFSRFARCTAADLYALGQESGDHLALTTGCYFGLVQQALVHKGVDAAKKAIEFYARVFPHTFVEVQHHNIKHEQDGHTDDWIVHQLMEIADDLNLHVIATQDCHYLDQPQKTAHELMKRMTYGEDGNEFPGDSFHMASTEWVAEHYTQEQWEQIEWGMSELLALNNVTISPLDEYRVDIPVIEGITNPKEHIVKVCRSGLRRYLHRAKIPTSEWPVYQDRLRYETGIISKLEMEPYFCIWERFVAWCRGEHIAIEARGSANGSLVCFLMGITQVDPIIWGTMFERFLSLDRIKPPDVDMDIEDEERPRALHYLLSLYNSIQIGTFSKLGITVNDEGEETGSILVSWKAMKRRECTDIATKAYERGRLEKKGDIQRYANGIFQRQYAAVTSVGDVKRVSVREHRGLRQIDAMGSVYKSYGVHASGLLLSGQRIKIEDYIPTMLVASSNTTVTQFDMDDVEEFGLLKMDLLGQATLRSMKLANALIRPDKDPTDFTWIPFDDSKACQLLREGRTNTGIFHYEGYTKAKGGKELQIKNTMDAVLGQALFMPGCMDVAPGMDISQKDLYIQRRRSPLLRTKITYLHPAFEDALKMTYGAVVFQEQVIQIMRGLGMDIAGINTFFKVVKDSGRGSGARNQQRMKEVRGQFDALCRKNKIDPDEAWKQTAAFVSYGFNRCTVGSTLITMIDKDAEVYRASANQHSGNTVTVERLFKLLHNRKPSPGKAPKYIGPCLACGEKPAIIAGQCRTCASWYSQFQHRGLKVLAHKDGRLVPDDLIDVVQNGVQDVYKVILETGHSITATAEHRHLKADGTWCAVENLQEGDELLVMGERESQTNEGYQHLPLRLRELVYERSNYHCELCNSEVRGRMEIAHLDSDRSNNRPSNLKLLCNNCHKKLDYEWGSRKKRWSKGRPAVPSRIVRIEYAGEEMTYDVCMKGDDHSWVGNGIVTHNSHATGYGIRSYRTGYMKGHYPLQFMTGLLQTWAGRPSNKKVNKEQTYITESRRIGLRVLPPDVNDSQMTWTIDPPRHGIRKGLLSVDGVGHIKAFQIAKMAPYNSVEDMVQRLPARALSGGVKYLETGIESGTIGKLIAAGAMDSILKRK